MYLMFHFLDCTLVTWKYGAYFVWKEAKEYLGTSTKLIRFTTKNFSNILSWERYFIAT